MRTLYTTLFTALLGMNASAQVVFDQPNALPDDGVHQRQQWDGLYTGLPISGTNVVWDLSTGLAPFGSIVPTLFAPPSTTPGALDFPDATHAQGDVFVPGDTTWLYYRLTGDSLWIDGARYQGGELWTCDSPFLIAYFPYSIGDLAECYTNCSYNGEPPVFLNQGFRPVATGTILYPGGSIPNVVMVQYYYYGTPDVYAWVSMDNILLSHGQYSGDYASLWIPESGSGVEDNAATALLHAYPSPAQAEVFVEVADRTGLVPFTLLDAAGRILNSGTLNTIGGRVRLDVSGLSPGNYVLRLAVEGASAHARVSVVR